MTTKQITTAPPRFLRALKKAFSGCGLSLRKVAKEVGISPAYLSLLLKGERGVPGEEILSKLEEVLDVQPRGVLFDAAGLQDRLMTKALKKDNQRILLRSLAPLSNDDFAKVVKVAEKLAQKYQKQSK